MFLNICVSQATQEAEIQPDERDGIEECKVSSEVSVENAGSDLMLHYDGDMQTTIESCSRYTVYSIHFRTFIHIFPPKTPQFYAV